MPEAVPVTPSPEGVPGAVTDPARVLGEDLTYPGAGGDPVNAYLATPTAPTAPTSPSDPAAPAAPPIPAAPSIPTEPAALAAPSASAAPASPVGAGARPAIVVIHEAGGLGEHIRDVTNRFANLGYTALGVDLYTREGGPPPKDDIQALMARLFAIPDARVLGDLEGAADLLRARADASGKVGCIGFCMGGRYTLLFACASDRLDAAADCWGGFIDAATPDAYSTPERPTPPLEMAGRLSCPLLAAVGAEDHNPAPALGEQLRERASASGQEVTVDVYEGAGHAFFADYRPSYRPAPAALLWERVIPFFGRHLGAG